ncbi:hypothetical protein Prudu_003844 [Prunus dulcis]|uniref:Uncharacterized protein n=1 Tax=Prunus dulcis TaxID=3755 RepID=A0A4Y1QU41_PRUDU|nr:hypothetical protein Prudu_003844 [Prunus dulcis]
MGIAVAYSAPTRHGCLKVVENNYCASKRASSHKEAPALCPCSGAMRVGVGDGSSIRRNCLFSEKESSCNP